MSGKLTAELESIKSELLAIANEIDGISSEIRRDFEGVGNDRCAKSLDGFSSHCRYVKKRLDAFDLTYIDSLRDKKSGRVPSGDGGGGGSW